MNSNITLIFEKGIEEGQQNFIPKMDIEGKNLLDFIPKYLRVIFTGTNTDADDTILIRVWACYQN